MFSILAVCFLIFCLLLFAEYLSLKKKVSTEITRKIVHMGSGILIAFLPYFVDYFYIQALSIILLAVVLFSAKFNIFKSIHRVKRITKGEVLFALGIGICAFLEPAYWIFAIAILHLAIADALAAIVGTKWGKRTKYTILSHGKSLLGSITFFYSSMAIFTIFILFSSEPISNYYILLIVIPAVLTFIENISWYGLDNVTIPVLTIVLLSSVS